MLRLLAVTVLVFIVGCAAPPGASAPSPSSPETASAPPPHNGQLGQLADLRYTCGGHPFGFDALTGPGNAELEAHPTADALRAFLAGGEARDLVPNTGWHLAGRDARTASYVALAAGDPPFAEVQLELDAGAWKVVGFGQCRPTLDLEGLNAALFQYAGPPPGPGDRRFDVLVTEIECAGGRPMGARLQRPQIAVTPDAVYVVFTVVAQAGAHDCPSNPSTRVTVELPEPLGERPVRDAAVFPFHDPAEDWPPG